MTHHGRGLRRLLQDDALFEAIRQDWRQAGLSERRQAMLHYVEKLTRQPAAMVADDVASLKAVDFSDADILAIAEVAAYYAYVNRIADGLGVQVETGADGDAA